MVIYGWKLVKNGIFVLTNLVKPSIIHIGTLKSLRNLVLGTLNFNKEGEKNYEKLYAKERRSCSFLVCN